MFIRLFEGLTSYYDYEYFFHDYIYVAERRQKSPWILFVFCI